MISAAKIFRTKTSNSCETFNSSCTAETEASTAVLCGTEFSRPVSTEKQRRASDGISVLEIEPHDDDRL